MRAVAVEEDARLRRAVRLEAVEAARVPEERPGDGGADREGADEHDDAGGGDLQPSLHVQPSFARAQSPMRRSVNVAGAFWLRRQRPNRRSSRLRFGGSGSGAGGSTSAAAGSGSGAGGSASVRGGRSSS